MKTAQGSRIKTQPASDHGRRRALVRRGSRDDRSSPLAQRTSTLRDGTMCERCAAVYQKKHWRAGTAGEQRWPVGFEWTVCPACAQVESGQYFGRVILRGRRALQDEPAIRRRIQNVAARAQLSQPERRIVSIERHGDEIEVLTTSQKLAHRIAQALIAAFGGTGTYAWSGGDGELRATWTWDDEPSVPESGKPAPVAALPGPTRAARLREAAAAVGKSVPELTIRCRHVELDPIWRSMIQDQVAAWADRYPDLTLFRVTLTHGRHHRRGVEEAAAQAVLAGRSLHATKERETMILAIRDVLRSIERELSGTRPRRRGIVRRPAAR